jgi:hypothetical protein
MMVESHKRNLLGESERIDCATRQEADALAARKTRETGIQHRAVTHYLTHSGPIRLAHYVFAEQPPYDPHAGRNLEEWRDPPPENTLRMPWKGPPPRQPTPEDTTRFPSRTHIGDPQDAPYLTGPVRRVKSPMGRTHIGDPQDAPYLNRRTLKEMIDDDDDDLPYRPLRYPSPFTKPFISPRPGKTGNVPCPHCGQPRDPFGGYPERKNRLIARYTAESTKWGFGPAGRGSSDFGNPAGSYIPGSSRRSTIDLHANDMSQKAEEHNQEGVRHFDAAVNALHPDAKKHPAQDQMRNAVWTGHIAALPQYYSELKAAGLTTPKSDTHFSAAMTHWNDPSFAYY